MTTDPSKDNLPENCLPQWEIAELPEPKPLGLNNLAGFIGPGIVMCGIQIGGGEWLFGPDITARYGGGLMWIATIRTAAFVDRPGISAPRLRVIVMPTQNLGPGCARMNPVNTGSPV